MRAAHVLHLLVCNSTGVMHVDRENREVVVRAGTMLRDLNSVLRDNGLALSSLPTLVDQTVGGALAVGEYTCWCPPYRIS